MRETSWRSARVSLVLFLVLLLSLPAAWLVFGEATKGFALSTLLHRQREPVAESSLFLQYTNAGLAYYRNHQYGEAEKNFREALKESPESALGLNNLGAVLNDEGRFDSAITVLERAVALDPNLEIARNNLAWARSQLLTQRR